LHQLFVADDVTITTSYNFCCHETVTDFNFPVLRHADSFSCAHCKQIIGKSLYRAPHSVVVGALVIAHLHWRGT
jgi:hypothetical protein